MNRCASNYVKIKINFVRSVINSSVISATLLVDLAARTTRKLRNSGKTAGASPVCHAERNSRTASTVTHNSSSSTADILISKFRQNNTPGCIGSCEFIRSVSMRTFSTPNWLHNGTRSKVGQGSESQSDSVRAAHSSILSFHSKHLTSPPLSQVLDLQYTLHDLQLRDTFSAKQADDLRLLRNDPLASKIGAATALILL
ncbi:hypothetical protein DFH94DRAFT_398727 [Russula ochroleuca]|jgi:hypothetical protein|uniref:Uncharacterized protein n=1 Tax=Russula ochroleuca TaxID=152965 RepID=A0A9P5JVQ8_9AGAM|nr:hypothetical protein DFH94DRAFT_398727 [Russula ochroleuca]